MIYYAHTKDDDKSGWQTVKDHLFNTAKLAREFGGDSKVADFAYIAALLHDIGKYSQAFQRRLEGIGGKVDHSTAGAQEIKRLFDQDDFQKAMAVILGYCIAGHHGGLPDHGSPIDCEDEGSLIARLNRKLEPYNEYTREIDLSDIQLPKAFPIKPIKKYADFSLAFFTRMIYSILVDADYQETETFVRGSKKPRGGHEDLGGLSQRFDQFLLGFDRPQNSINQKRTETLQACMQQASLPPGFFKLTIPTGGGKTFTSLAFALKHALLYNKKRIIYVIPFTSIIEQNAGVIKNCLGADNVLEHHSNFDWNPRNKHIEVEFSDDLTNNAIDKLKLAAENWDIPVVVTTNVQFFESLFANRSSRCRKLHNIANSVIIFDEAQMLPRNYLKPCLYALHELVNNYGASAIFCTATQPVLNQFFPDGTELRELAPNPQDLFTYYKRVQVKNLSTLKDSELSSQVNSLKQVLCIVNTRKHARGLYDLIVDEGRFHLSTLMCPEHRKETIAIIKGRLKSDLPCRVISTQIMEAGIDVDFPVGYRAISGLDSIIQAAGRVNREQKALSGDLFVFEPESEFVKRTPAYIEQGAAVARNILRKYTDPICMEAVQEYYATINSLQSENASDNKNILGCFQKAAPFGLNFDFKTAAEKFKLIEDNTLPVIIRYNADIGEILDQVKSSLFPASFSRKLQIYTVNIYEREFQALQNLGLIDVYAETYSVLNDMSYYSRETGLFIPESTGADGIYFDG